MLDGIINEVNEMNNRESTFNWPKVFPGRLYYIHVKSYVQSHHFVIDGLTL